MKRAAVTLIVAGVAALASCSRADAQPPEPAPGPLDASHYVWQTARDGGGAVVHSAFGGEYIYSAAGASTAAADGRRAFRFALGKPARTEYTLFSAEEEVALWKLREQHRRRDDPPVPRAVKRAASSRVPEPRIAAPSVDWPKVVVLAGRTCVPQAEFEHSPHWREHLVCWLKETQRVE